ncbi:MAG: methylenetetrahydrofolate reductase C-terminal domain-containing protein [Verrucomicrobiota bacterium]|nr:methylenetetrahydrofolate reductase C-terminal domain-containing protein [Verrucomicrobiota bacterium]
MKRLKDSLLKNPGFTVIAELTSGLGYSMDPIVEFLEAHKASGGDGIPEGFDFAGIALPQNPGGIANLDPADVLAQLAATDLLNDLDFIPHMSCKDHNQSALNSVLVGYRQRNVQSILALTGDKPVSAKGVFELEAVGLLQLISKMNRTEMLKGGYDDLGDVPRFFSGAAVSPFKYSEPSQLQQYFKMEKKAACGARFFITQVGWDWKKSLELKFYMEEAKLNVPVIGNTYFLTTTNAAPRLMNTGKLPGCFVSDEFLAALKQETKDQHIERCAQQVAMYKSMGYAGIDLGGVHDYETFCTILKRAAEIGESWTEFKDNLCWPPDNGFYLYDQEGERSELGAGRKTLHQRGFNFMHKTLLDPDHKGFHGLKKTMELAGAEKKPEGLAAKSLFAMERIVKHAAFECEECGDCFLSENFGFCTMGGCAKGLANVPCGDANVDGTCGNEEGATCRGEQIYHAAKADEGGLEKLRATINNPRNPALEHTSSILNYLFGKDHTMKNAIITIGEDIHASIPKHGAVMRELHGLGEGAYKNDSPQLGYIRALVEKQAAEGADYIALNVDDFGKSDPALAAKIMVEYVKLVRKWGGMVPACIDSSDDNVLIAGLKEWYNTDDPVKPPLVNSIKTYTADNMMPFKKEFDFSFIGLLMSEEAASSGTMQSVDDLVALAKELFEKAMAHGFQPSEIFFDSTVFPLAIDMPMEPGVAGYTYRAFETIKAIKNDPTMRGVHFSMGISNCCRDLPGRKIGIARAYVEKAMECGLDAGIVNAAHKFGAKPADPKLAELVAAYAAMDGDMDKTSDAIELMGEFCDSFRK